MPKFFVFSDVHSFYTELQTALDEAGYDPLNEDHWLISCGDNFDRGDETLAMFRFLMKSPRLILVKGNHEDLLEDMCMRGYPYTNDKQNHTVDTVRAFDPKMPIDVACDTAYHTLRPLMRQMRNYFETENYVFVHGWIPIPCQTKNMICNVAIPSACHGDCPNSEWRDAPYSEWEAARWKNGMDMARNGFIIPDKTIVCGHWHCSYGHYMVAKDEAKKNGDNEFFCNAPEYYMFGEEANFSPFYDEGIIAIDACTAYTKKVNVIVIEDNFIEEEI